MNPCLVDKDYDEDAPLMTTTPSPQVEAGAAVVRARVPGVCRQCSYTLAGQVLAAAEPLRWAPTHRHREVEGNTIKLAHRTVISATATLYIFRDREGRYFDTTQDIFKDTYEPIKGGAQ